MSRYTTELRFICEQYAGLDKSTDYNDVEQVIEHSRAKVFNFNYPIFDEEYRSVIETKILKHFYTREIGFETVGLWRLKLNTKLNEIMPYYNQLYESELLEFNPLYDVDVTRQSKRAGSENNTDIFNEKNTTEHDTTITKEEQATLNKTTTEKNNTTTTANSNDNVTEALKQRYSDTPQGSLQNIENDTYLTNATLNDNTRKTTSNADSTVVGTTNADDTQENNVKSTDKTTGADTASRTGENTQNKTNLEDYIETVKGKQGGGSYAEILIKFRETFLNIDMMIINDLDELFFGLW